VSFSFPTDSGHSGIVVQPVPAPSSHWIGLIFLTLAVLTSVIDSSVMTVATPTISKAFKAGLPEVEWNTTIYSLVFGATMLLWGKLGATYGYRRVFILCNILFALGSVLVGCAPTIGTMITMRALQGMGAAMFNPSAIALIALMFTDEKRPLAYGINGMAGSIGVALGYVVGGICAEYFGWRWAFYLNLPICLVAIVGAMVFVPGTHGGHGLPLDFEGATLSLLGLGLIIFGLSEAQTLGWWHLKAPLMIFHHTVPLPFSVIPLAIVAGVILMFIFARRQLRWKRQGKEPLFDVTLFSLPSFRWGGIVSLLRYLAQFTVNYGLTLYLQLDEGIPAFKAALISLPNALAGLFAAPFGGWLANRIGAARAVQIGILFQAIGIAWVWQIISPTISVWQLAGPFAVFGFGSGLAGAQLNTASLQDVETQRMGDAASAVTTLRQLGASFAVAIFSLITSTTMIRLAIKGDNKITSNTVSMQDVVLVMFLISVLCLIFSCLIPNRRPPSRPKLM
jgi:EmrB/QacA subfamily drug resistance transporter